MDTFSKTDTVIYLYKKSGDLWIMVGQTEVIHDNLNPKFVSKFSLEYEFHKKDIFRADMYDIDDDEHIHDLDK